MTGDNPTTLEDAIKMLKELRDEMSAMKAKDESEAEKVEDESEEEKAEDESEEEKAEDEDMEKPQGGMDSMKHVFKEIAQRDALVKRLTPHIGVFDHSEKTLSEVAGYAIKKLGVPCKKGQEQAAIEGFLRGARVSTPAMAQDSAPVNSGCIDAYLAGGK